MKENSVISILKITTCFFAGYINTWGHGTLKIINSCKEAALPEPDIKELNGGVEVTIYLQTDVNELDGQEGGAIGGTIGGVIGGQTGGTIGDLTARQKDVLEIINGDNKVSIKGIAGLLNINKSASQEHIEKLKEKGIIKRVGGTRGHWKILIEL